MERPFSERGRTMLCLLFLVGLVVWFQLPFVLDRAIVVERDALSSILPLRAYLARAFSEGTWPMWNPATVLGKPFLGEWQSGLFYPPSALLLVPPFTRGFNLFFVFHYVWTAIGALLLLRVLGATHVAALLGAVVWVLGGPIVSLGHLLNHLMAIAWLPWVLWAWQRGHTSLLRVATASVMLSLALLTGSPEMVLVIVGALLLLARSPLALLVPALSAGLAAAQLVPVWLYLGETHRGVHGIGAEGVMAYSATWDRLFEMFRMGGRSPDAFLPSVHLGVLPAVLALIGLLAAPRALQLVSLLAAFTIAGLALGSNAGLLPLLHAHLPLVDLLRYPEKLLLGLHAMIALGTSFGLSRLAARMPPRLAGLFATVVLAVVTVDLVAANRGLLATLPSTTVQDPPPAARAMLADAPSETAGLPTRYYANAVPRPESASPAISAALDRAVLIAATGELYGLSDVNTPASLNLLAHEDLERALESVPREQALSALAALGTGYVTSFASLDGSPQLTPMAMTGESAGGRLYRLDGAKPRAFLAQRVEHASDASSALRRFVTASSEERSGLAVVENREDSLTVGAGGVRWITYTPDALELEVELRSRGLLVVTDTYLSGWRARVDGNFAPIERVNGVVRGVWLDGGRHRVRMEYRSPGLITGVCISLAALVVLVGLCSESLRRRLPFRIRAGRSRAPKPALPGRASPDPA